MTTKYFMDVAVEGELWRLKDSNGKPPGLIGIKPESAVTFIDNHDTWSQNYCLSHLIKSCLDMLTLSPILAPQAYSMITSLSGGGRRSLRNLTAIRARNGINSKSSVTILAAEGDLSMANKHRRQDSNEDWAKVGPRRP